MKVGIIIEYSNIYEVKIVKTVYGDSLKDMSNQFWDSIEQHLRVVPEVGSGEIKNGIHYFVFEGLDKSKFPMLPMRINNAVRMPSPLVSNYVYQDYYGKWKLIIL